MSSSGNSSASVIRTIADTDPVTRNAIRYTVSAREYALLHRYLISRTPVLKDKSPKPETREIVPKEADDYNAATVRATVRLFVASYSGLKTWEFVTQHLFARGTSQ